jgi:hypothetical protein
MFSDLTPNQIGITTLFVTLAGLIVAIIVYKRSLARSELSNVRINLIHRLELLPRDGELNDNKLSTDERTLVYGMNIQIIERDIQKYRAVAKASHKHDLEGPLKALMTFKVDNIVNQREQFRYHCYRLIARVDKAYYQEIKVRTCVEVISSYQYEIKGVFFGLSSIYMLFQVLSIMFS